MFSILNKAAQLGNYWPLVCKFLAGLFPRGGSQALTSRYLIESKNVTEAVAWGIGLRIASLFGRPVPALAYTGKA
jgi:hypothetical protein